METHPAVAALTGAVIGGLVALLAGIALVLAGPEIGGASVSTPTSASVLGVIVGAIIGGFGRPSR